MPMTDLEKVKRCAERMGYVLRTTELGELALFDGMPFYSTCVRALPPLTTIYFPLTNKAQAFELVERFDLSVWGNSHAAGELKCHAEYGHPDDDHALGHGPDLCHAIVECVSQIPGEGD